MTSIHRLVLRRLFLAWLIVSLLAGTLTYTLEYRRIDAAIDALVAAETDRFASEVRVPDSRQALERQALREASSDFFRRNFIRITVYDPGGQPLNTVHNPRHAELDQSLERLGKTMPGGNGRSVERLTVNGEKVLKFKTQLPGRDNRHGTHIAAFLRIDPAAQAQFEASVWRTLAAVLIAVLVTTLMLYPLIMHLNRDVLRFSHDVLVGNLEMASVLGTAIAKRDSDTGAHNFRVTLYAIALGEVLGLPAPRMQSLILGAFLHDVGKIGIRDHILLKPGKLTAEEFVVMRTHVALGIDIISQSDWLQGAREVIECHHEKFDGSGYLQGLAGEAIPLNARIFAIVDVFDALTSVRPYKSAMPVEEALAILDRDAGTHFDPALVNAFSGVAARLYTDIGRADEAALHARLREQAAHYYLHASIAGKPLAA